MSKRTDRVAIAKARPTSETEELRRRERAPAEPSIFARLRPSPTKRLLDELRAKLEGRLKQ